MQFGDGNLFCKVAFVYLMSILFKTEARDHGQAPDVTGIRTLLILCLIQGSTLALELPGEFSHFRDKKKKRKVTRDLDYAKS